MHSKCNDQQRSIRGRKEDPAALSDEAQNKEYLFLCERMEAPPDSSGGDKGIFLPGSSPRMRRRGIQSQRVGATTSELQ